ncbi:MAG: DUF2336 domain-containing protein [Beijerinckiaceae bacterium]
MSQTTHKSTEAALSSLQSAFEAKDFAERADAAEKITDLFIMGAANFSDTHVALFDQVIGMLAAAIEIRARARLSEKLADVENAPPEVVRKLSRDEIVVARPVLARSPRLTEEDLVEAARHGGRDHMLAISERRNLTEPVTDVLVNEGDRVVVNSVASNPTARFSAKGYDALIAKSKADELLQAALGRRNDIPARHMAMLFELAKRAARERLQGEIGSSGRRTISQAVNISARDIAAETVARSEAYRFAVQEVSALVQDNALSELILVDYARAKQMDHAICAVAYLAKLPLNMIERALTTGDNDLLLIISRSINLSWATVRLMLLMRTDHKPTPRQLDTLSESYTKLTSTTAQRVLRFLHARETAGSNKA